MKKLSRDEIKKLAGGVHAGDEGGEKLCNSDADCTSPYVCRQRATDGVCRCVKGSVIFPELD